MKTVLIVDDEPLICGSVRHILAEARGVRIIGDANNGVQALQLIERLTPDIIITDVKMPVMDGLSLIREAKARGAKSEFIIISGYADFGFAQQAINYGVVRYVLKPIKEAELIEAVESCGGNEHALPEESGNAERLIKYIQQHYGESLSLDSLSLLFNFSPKYITNLIKKKVGRSFTDYLTDLRIREASELLTKTSTDIKVIAAKVGYDDQQYFHRVFKRRTGKTPAQFRREF